MTDRKVVLKMVMSLDGFEEHLKLDIVEEERFQSGALAQILVPKR